MLLTIPTLRHMPYANNLAYVDVFLIYVFAI